MKKNQPIFGRNPVMELLKSGEQVEKVLLQSNVRGPFEKELRQYCKENAIPLKILPRERMDRLISGNHQGVAAFVSDITFYKLADVLPMIYEQGGLPLIVILDAVTDVRNFGAIARSAEVFGAHALVIPIKNAAQINAEAVKTSAGAIYNIHICREASLANAVEFLQDSGVQVFASSLQSKKTISEIDFDLPCALVVGSEGEGVNKHLLKNANETFIIPQVGKTDSLNVSVAAGVMLYEVNRQRG